VPALPRATEAIRVATPASRSTATICLASSKRTAVRLGALRAPDRASIARNGVADTDLDVATAIDLAVQGKGSFAEPASHLTIRIK
jgi:hypothetical protein